MKMDDWYGITCFSLLYLLCPLAPAEFIWRASRWEA